MPFKTYSNWLFDGNKDSPVPPELLAYNCPVTQKYAVRMFVLSGELNQFLDEHFNHMGLWYMDKEELFTFLKKCVMDFRIRRNSIPFISSRRKSDKLFDVLKRKLPLMKPGDISLLCQIINKSEDKGSIYYSLGLEKDKKPKKRKLKQKKETPSNISWTEFLEKNFNIMEVEK